MPIKDFQGWLKRQEWAETLKTTLMSGVIFLIPLLVVGYVLAKLLGAVRTVVGPIADAAGLTSFGGVTAVTILTVVVVLLIAYACGLVAKTQLGQAFIKWIENGVVTLIPAFNVVEGFAKSLGPDGANILVVLVPTDAGWASGLVFEPPKDEWYAVFLPGSPEWTSGSVSFAHVSDVQVLDISVANLAMIMRRRGVGSSAVLDHLARSRAVASVGEASRARP